MKRVNPRKILPKHRRSPERILQQVTRAAQRRGSAGRRWRLRKPVEVHIPAPPDVSHLAPRWRSGGELEAGGELEEMECERKHFSQSQDDLLMGENWENV